MEPISSIPAGAGPLAAPLASDEKQGVLSSDFETFIKMLTAQMQNQDPLNPMESSDFATQLATFSSVEQQVLTNDLLSSLGAQMGALNLSQASGWVGMQARAVMPVRFDGSPVSLQIHGSATAQSHQLVVRDETGAVLSREDITGKPQEVIWQGRNAFGAELPLGTYDIAVESFAQGELVATTPAAVEGQIMEARPENGLVSLVFEGGQEVPSDRILSLGRV